MQAINQYFLETTPLVSTVAEERTNEIIMSVIASGGQSYSYKVTPLRN
jgi:hypothetical protein